MPYLYEQKIAAFSRLFGYHRVDLEIVWVTINRHLSDLHVQISEIKDQLES